MTDLGANVTPAETGGSSSVSRRVFVLGAGFSKAVSDLMPNTTELGRCILEELKLPENLTRGNFEDWLSRLGEVQPDVPPEENLQRQSYFHRIVDKIGIILEKKQTAIVCQKNDLPLWLFRFIEVLHVWQSTLISFNYDNLIELATGYAELSPPRSPGAASSVTVTSGDIMGQKPPLPNGPSRAPNASFRLWKLHGSLAWWWVPSDPTGLTICRWPLDIEEQREIERKGILLDYGGSSNSLPSEPPEDDIKKRERLLYGRSRYIAPPSGLKSSYYQNPFMSQLWQDSRRALHNATEVYFVGYSMPPADTAARGLFRESIPMSATLFVVNPDPDPIYNQLTEWGYHQVKKISDENCVETMVGNIEQQCAREAIDNLRAELNDSKVELSDDDKSRVIWRAKRQFHGQLEISEVEGNSLVLRQKSNQTEVLAKDPPGQHDDGTTHANLTGCRLRDLLRDDQLEEIVIHLDDQKFRMISHELHKDQTLGDSFSLSELWLRIPHPMCT